jgi:hypothetical protein
MIVNAAPRIFVHSRHAGRANVKIAKAAPLIIIVFLSLSEIGSASTERIPDVQINIHYKAGGVVHVFRAVHSAAADAGLTCTPSVEEVDWGTVSHYNGKEITLHPQMICVRPSYGVVDAVAFNYTSPDQIEVRAYYDPDVPRLSVRGVIDGIIDRIEAVLKADPLIPAIEQTDNVDSRLVVSRIK